MASCRTCETDEPCCYEIGCCSCECECHGGIYTQDLYPLTQPYDGEATSGGV
jgi:hypothetical protein